MFQYEALTFQQIKDPSSFRSGQVHERSNNNGAGNNGLPDLEYRLSRSHHLPKHKGFNKAGNHIDWIVGRWPIWEICLFLVFLIWRLGHQVAPFCPIISFYWLGIIISQSHISSVSTQPLRQIYGPIGNPTREIIKKTKVSCKNDAFVDGDQQVQGSIGKSKSPMEETSESCKCHNSLGNKGEACWLRQNKLLRILQETLMTVLVNYAMFSIDPEKLENITRVTWKVNNIIMII